MKGGVVMSSIFDGMVTVRFFRTTYILNATLYMIALIGIKSEHMSIVHFFEKGQKPLNDLII